MTDAGVPRAASASAAGVGLVIADVDGTLVSHAKVLTPRAKEAVGELRSAGIAFAITSGRPPRGMKMLVDDLKLDTPVAGFNGGVFVTPTFEVLETHDLERDSVETALAVLAEHGITAWLYDHEDWYVPDPDGPHVAREADTVKFSPKVRKDFRALTEGAVKVVGVSDDADAIARCRKAVREALGDTATAELSQPYYLDITSADATKGAVVRELSARLGVANERIVTIGDMPNDVAMFATSGFSIAMGNASDAVKAQATAATGDCDHDGFADAMQRFVLRHGHGATAGPAEAREPGAPGRQRSVAAAATSGATQAGASGGGERGTV